MEPYTTRLQKGGALLADMRRMLLAWDGSPGCADRIVRENELGLRSRSRAYELVIRTFLPRFVRSVPPDLWRPMQVLERAGWAVSALLPLHLYAAARAEPLLWDFAVRWLAPRVEAGRLEVATADVLTFLDEAPDRRFPDGRWSHEVSIRVARGLLATLRDLGALSGTVRKQARPAMLPAESAAVLARWRVEAGTSPARILADPAWRLYALSESSVERLLLEGHRRGLVSYHAAGTLVRLEFPSGDLQSHAEHVASRAH